MDGLIDQWMDGWMDALVNERTVEGAVGRRREEGGGETVHS